MSVLALTKRSKNFVSKVKALKKIFLAKFVGESIQIIRTRAVHEEAVQTDSWILQTRFGDESINNCLHWRYTFCLQLFVQLYLGFNRDIGESQCTSVRIWADYIAGRLYTAKIDGLAS